jgi:hypothetical protein
MGEISPNLVTLVLGYNWGGFSQNHLVTLIAAAIPSLANFQRSPKTLERCMKTT